MDRAAVNAVKWTHTVRTKDGDRPGGRAALHEDLRQREPTFWHCVETDGDRTALCPVTAHLLCSIET